MVHAHRLLSLVLADAVKNGAVARNVAKVHKPPQPEQSEIEILDADQVEGVLKGLMGHFLRPIVSMALDTGMRAASCSVSSGASDATLLFTDRNGEMLWPDDLTRIWARVCLAKGLPKVTFHALRHTHGSMLINPDWTCSLSHEDSAIRSRV